MRSKWLLILAVMSAGACSDDTPPPPRASIPPVGTYTVTPDVPAKPLPQPASMGNSPPTSNGPSAVNQPPTEQTAFVMLYERVGRPRLSVLMNRTLSGQIVPTTGSSPAEPHDGTDTYLAPGQYDVTAAQQIDYDGIEKMLANWISSNGQVTVVSPHLTDSESSQLQKGQLQPLPELSQKYGVDVLIQVQAHVTKQTPQGLSIRLIAEAMNTKGDESLGRAFVDVPAPLEKTALNDYTRFLAEKLMNDMTAAWNAPRPAPIPPSTQVQ